MTSPKMKTENKDRQAHGCNTSIDGPEFRELLDDYVKSAAWTDGEPDIAWEECALSALIAHIDAWGNRRARKSSTMQGND